MFGTKKLLFVEDSKGVFPRNKDVELKTKQTLFRFDDHGIAGIANIDLSDIDEKTKSITEDTQDEEMGQENEIDITMYDQDINQTENHSTIVTSNSEQVVDESLADESVADESVADRSVSQEEDNVVRDYIIRDITKQVENYKKLSLFFNNDMKELESYVITRLIKDAPKLSAIENNIPQIVNNLLRMFLRNVILKLKSEIRKSKSKLYLMTNNRFEYENINKQIQHSESLIKYANDCLKDMIPKNK